MPNLAKDYFLIQKNTVNAIEMVSARLRTFGGCSLNISIADFDRWKNKPPKLNIDYILIKDNLELGDIINNNYKGEEQLWL